MTVDTIANASAHCSLGPRIAAGLRFLSDTDLLALEPGRHDILGDECYAMVDDYLTAPRDGKRWECHRRHIDIQFVARGRELLGRTDLSNMTSAEYDPAKDLEFLDGPDCRFVTIEAGTFAILYPEDAHMPGVSIDGPEAVRKVVVKVLV